MKQTNSQTPVRDPHSQAQPRSTGRGEEWVLEAVRHVFEEAMANRRR